MRIKMIVLLFLMTSVIYDYNTIGLFVKPHLKKCDIICLEGGERGKKQEPRIKMLGERASKKKITDCLSIKTYIKCRRPQPTVNFELRIKKQNLSLAS